MVTERPRARGRRRAECTRLLPAAPGARPRDGASVLSVDPVPKRADTWTKWAQIYAEQTAFSGVLRFRGRTPHSAPVSPLGSSRLAVGGSPDPAPVWTWGRQPCACRLHPTRTVAIIPPLVFQRSPAFCHPSKNSALLCAGGTQHRWPLAQPAPACIPQRGQLPGHSSCGVLSRPAGALRGWWCPCGGVGAGVSAFGTSAGGQAAGR